MQEKYDPAHWSAAICRRGHVISRMIEEAATTVPTYCPECGAAVLQSCPTCQGQIPGAPLNARIIYYTVPNFCRWCGAPFPWASRNSIVHHLENQLDREPNLAEGDRRKILDALDALREAPSTDDVEERQTTALRLLKIMAPKAWQVAAPVIQSLTTSLMRQHLGLPPTP
jgi:hypothetical protein